VKKVVEGKKMGAVMGGIPLKTGPLAAVKFNDLIHS